MLKSRSDWDDVVKAKDIKRPRSYVIYGRSGTGKTTLSATFPKPLLLLDIKDRGTDSIANVEDVDIIEIEDWQHFEEIYHRLLADNNGYKTVVIDTVTQLQGMAIEEILRKKKKDPKRAGDWGVMTKQEWGDVAKLMKKYIEHIRDLPLQTVFNAQDRVFNVGDEADEEVMLQPEVGPRLSPAVASHLNAAVHVIAQTFLRLRRRVVTDEKGKKKEVEKIQYCLRIGPDPLYITKFRKDKEIELTQVLVNPSYGTILEEITDGQ